MPLGRTPNGAQVPFFPILSRKRLLANYHKRVMIQVGETTWAHKQVRPSAQNQIGATLGVPNTSCQPKKALNVQI